MRLLIIRGTATANNTGVTGPSRIRVSLMLSDFNDVSDTYCNLLRKKGDRPGHHGSPQVPPLPLKRIASSKITKRAITYHQVSALSLLPPQPAQPCSSSQDTQEFSSSFFRFSSMIVLTLPESSSFILIYYTTMPHSTCDKIGLLTADIVHNLFEN